MRQEAILAALVGAHAEAKSLLRLVGKNGDTVETVRELIGVPPRIAAEIQAYLRAHPEDEPAFGTVLSFRQRVSEEFERLVTCCATEAKEL